MVWVNGDGLQQLWHVGGWRCWWWIVSCVTNCVTSSVVSCITNRVTSSSRWQFLLARGCFGRGCVVLLQIVVNVFVQPCHDGVVQRTSGLYGTTMYKNNREKIIQNFNQFIPNNCIGY